MTIDNFFLENLENVENLKKGREKNQIKKYCYGKQQFLSRSCRLVDKMMMTYQQKKKMSLSRREASASA